jgi:DNA polymerase I-like protein with 3'-5' exonuclease and polymerase domains
MTPYGLAHKTGRSLLWARGIFAQHQRIYSTFHRWRGDVVTEAKFAGFIESELGWPMTIDGLTKIRTLMNYPIQSSAADSMRLAAIEAAETGIDVCCTVHDAFWVLCPIEDIEQTKQRMTEIMRMAGAAITNGYTIDVEVAAEIPATLCLGDVRKPDKAPMWHEVRALLAEQEETWRNAVGISA